MATSPLQRDRALPYGLAPFALFFAVIEVYVLDMLRGLQPPGHIVVLFFDSLRMGIGFSWSFFMPALLEIGFWLALGLGVAVLIVALVRKRIFRPMFIAWLLLPPLYAVLLLTTAWPDNPMVLAGEAAIACAGIVYVWRSKAVAAFFDR